MKCGFILSVALAALLLTNAAPASAQQTWNTLPGEFAMRTLKGFYVTALSGGGLTASPTVVTASTTAGAWEKFRIAVMDPPQPNDKSFQTSNGHYLTAVDGGGRTSDVLHTDATQVRAWEQFRVFDLSAGGDAPTYFAVATINGHLLTAVGEGGKYEDAIHSDATQIGKWEFLRIVKCGDLGTNFQYTIIPDDEQPLTAVKGGGLDQGDTISLGYYPGESDDKSWSRFTFIRQPDGSYALQTANGVNFVTALNGGGEVQKYLPPNCGFPGACISGVSTIFHTDATQVRSWERFKFVDQGDCRYTIQTTSGFLVGIYQDSDGHTLMTTRRTQMTDDEKFQLVMFGLASPVVIH
jgi:hypothetical protein